MNDKVNYLLAEDVCDKPGLTRTKFGSKTVKGGVVANWSRPDQAFVWPVKTSQAGRCRVTLLVKIPEPATSLILTSEKDRIELHPTETGWHRVTGAISIADGSDTLTLTLSKEITGKQKAELIGIEVITEKHLPAHEKEIADFKQSLGDVSWFQDAGYGIMLQWGFWGYPPTGKRKEPWTKVYEEFDIEGFVERMAALNPGYVIWSVTWRGSRFAAPLESVKKIMGSGDYTMEYDFLGKLAEAFNKRGIPLFFYYHPGHEEKEFWNRVWVSRQDREKYSAANVAIWTEIGQRLGDKLAGWFIDGGMVIHYPTDFHAYVQALKASNPKRLVSFNQYMFPHCSPFEDVAMGENRCPGTIENGMLVDGPYKGLMPHTMLIFDGPDWGIWRPDTVINPPKSAEYWQDRINIAKKTKHPISFTILMYEDGTIGEKTEAVLKQLKR